MSINKPEQKTGAGWKFENSYLGLGEEFYARQAPEPVRKPRVVIFNHALAQSLGLDAEFLSGPSGGSIFGGNEVPPGSEPIAQAYAGHQFGHFAMLGDGRAILLGEHIAPDGTRFDIQLKGSGQTPFSRRGDGRATLGPMLREYIMSEAMHTLGIPTTRSLAVATTGETVYRETTLPGAILTRIAASHIRVGTFQYAASKGGAELVQKLADYTIQRHYPQLAKMENPYAALLNAVMERQAALVAKWQLVGFIHGVMNTDNMTLSGETIDYGPCAFMDKYDPATVFSSIDHQGRYAYGNQPPIAQWNLARLAETLLPLFDADEEKALAIGQEAVESFKNIFQRHWTTGMRAKLGLFHEEAEDTALFESLLNWMHESGADYTNTFRALSSEILPEQPLYRNESFRNWHALWQARLERQPETQAESVQLMRASNPSVIPRNHKVEEALNAAIEKEDYGVIQSLLRVLQNPYGDLPDGSPYCKPDLTQGHLYQTFCGT